jgi:hypothetical protein
MLPPARFLYSFALFLRPVIHGLFSHTHTVARVPSEGRLTGREMQQQCGTKRPWPDLRYSARILMRDWEEPHGRTSSPYLVIFILPALPIFRLPFSLHFQLQNTLQLGTLARLCA